MTSTRRIVVAAYQGVSLLDLTGPMEAFRLATALAGRDRGPARYECVVVSSRGGPVMTSTGVEIVTQPLEALDGKAIDTLVVPGGFLIEDVTGDRVLVDWVRERASDCTRVCSVCVGSFLLAAAGLLDGRRAATHWLHCGGLAERHPAMRLALVGQGAERLRQQFQRVGGDVARDLVDGVARRDELAARGRVDAVVARPLRRRARDAEVDLARAGVAHHLHDLA